MYNCPADGGLLMLIVPAPAIGANYFCSKCGKKWMVGAGGVVGEDFTPFMPKFFLESFELLKGYGAGLAASSSTAITAGEQVESRLSSLAARVDGQLKPDVTRALDDATSRRNRRAERVRRRQCFRTR